LWLNNLPLQALPVLQSPHDIKLAQLLLRRSMSRVHGEFTRLYRVTKQPMQVIASAT
jgi:hypothetical protein